MNIMQEIQDWYAMQCDGDWEHSFGVKIDTLDNPGWQVTISLEGTLLEDSAFDPIICGDAEKDEKWFLCRKDNHSFIGMGDPHSLERILASFIAWAKHCTDTSPWDEVAEALKKKCTHYTEAADPVAALRAIYRDIEEIPNEHPEKPALLKLFRKTWQNALAVFTESF